MPVGGVDKFANIFQGSVAQAVINTLTFAEINIGLTLFDKVGILLHKIQWDVSNNYMTDMNAEGDRIRMAFTQSNTITGITVSERAVIEVIEHEVILTAAGVSSFISEQPFEMKFSDLPGGGLLVAPRPLYAAINTDGYANVQSATFRMYFTIMKLKPDEYFELLEARRFFG